MKKNEELAILESVCTLLGFVSHFYESLVKNEAQQPLGGSMNTQFN